MLTKRMSLLWALVLALAVALSASTAFAADTLPNGFTAKIVAKSGQTITGKVDATGFDLGIYIGPGVKNVRVVGATVSGASNEGILVQDASDVVIAGSTVTNNAVSPTVHEAKAITLAGTRNVQVTGNTVKANLGGGIRVTDDGPNSTFAPTSINSSPIASTGNLVAGNLLQDNAGGCAIVLSANNQGGGVSKNTVSGNNIVGGVGGIIVAEGPPPNTWGDVTDNVISGNRVTGGFLPGISLHATGPGVISGTRLIGNLLSNNGAGDFSGNSTGIEIAAIPGAGGISNTQVTGNRVVDDFFGVFHIGDTDTKITGLSTSGVTVPVAP